MIDICIWFQLDGAVIRPPVTLNGANFSEGSPAWRVVAAYLMRWLDSHGLVSCCDGC